jgi:uncharacterized membrane protein
MADLLGMNVDLPQLGGINLGVNWMIILIVFILISVAAIVIFLLYQYKIYNRKIILFENISGQGYQPILKDRARLIKVGDGGEEILYLRKSKVYRTAYGKKMGKRTYWFAVGQDGYWYNIVLGDLDAKMGMLDIEPIDRDMRYMHVAIRKNIKDRYQKQNFMEKYGQFVMSAIFLLIILVGIWVLLGKIGDISAANAAAMESSKAVVDKLGNVLSSMDNICVGGSGVKPAPIGG